MVRFARAAAVALLFTGCARPFDFEEAQAAARSTAGLGIASWFALTSDFEASQGRATDATLTWAETADGFTFEGTVTSDGPDWVGAIAFDGAFAGTIDTAAWEFGIDLDQCDDGRVLLDGSMDWAWSAEVDADSAHLEWSVQGEITASGEAEGTGEMDWTATLDITGSSVDYAVEGRVGGTPVDFSLTVNVPTR